MPPVAQHRQRCQKLPVKAAPRLPRCSAPRRRNRVHQRCDRKQPHGHPRCALCATGQEAYRQQHGRASSDAELLAHLEGLGFTVTYLEVDSEGRLDQAHIEAALTRQTAVLSLMWANNETGALFPIAIAAQMAKSAALVPHHAVQAMGKLEVDVRQFPSICFRSRPTNSTAHPVSAHCFVRKGFCCRR